MIKEIKVAIADVLMEWSRILGQASDWLWDVAHNIGTGS